MNFTFRKEEIFHYIYHIIILYHIFKYSKDYAIMINVSVSIDIFVLEYFFIMKNVEYNPSIEL